MTLEHTCIITLQDEARRYQVVRDLGDQVKHMGDQVGREERVGWESAAARLLVAVGQASPLDAAARDFNCG